MSEEKTKVTAPPSYTPHPTAPQVLIQAGAPPADEEGEDEFDSSPMFDYLGSERGHEVAQRVLGLFEGMRKATMDLTVKQAIAEKWFQATIITVVVVASTALAVLDKFSAPLGLLFGTLIGFVFGKRSSGS